MIDQVLFDILNFDSLACLLCVYKVLFCFYFDTSRKIWEYIIIIRYIITKLN